MFISHVSTNKQEADGLKYFLEHYGIVGFVAHRDIEPTEEWQTLIETALSSMDALVALLTPGFHDSSWTNQEVGFAIGRNRLVIPIQFGLDPHGLIGKYQGLQGLNKKSFQLAKDIFAILAVNPLTAIQMGRGAAEQLSNAESYEAAKGAIERLEVCSKLDQESLEKIQKAADQNPNVKGAWGVPARIDALIKKFG